MADLNLALLIFLVVFLTQLVAWVGKSVLQELVRRLRDSSSPRASRGVCL
jgi:hypothetical protein